jgi:AcrR family transcriptional regulator
VEIAHEKPAVERILRAALRCLARRDPGGVSLREIAEEAGVSKSLLLYHFRSKEDLLLGLVDGTFDAMARRVEAVTDALVTTRQAGVEALGASLDAIWRELRGAGELQGVLFRIAASATLEDGMRQRLIRFRTRLVHIIADGIRRALGKTAPVTALTPLAELLLACFVGLEGSRLFAEDPRALDAAQVLLKDAARLLAGFTR